MNVLFELNVLLDRVAQRVAHWNLIPDVTGSTPVAVKKINFFFWHVLFMSCVFFCLDVKIICGERCVCTQMGQMSSNWSLVDSYPIFKDLR